MQDEFLFKNTSKLQTHTSCKAALLVLFTSASSRQGEEVSTAIDLRCRLIEILVNAASTFNFHNDPGPTSSGPSLEPEPPATVQCMTDPPPFAMATPVTQSSCVTPLAPISDLSASEPPTQRSETPLNQDSVPEPGPSLPEHSRSKLQVISTGNLLQRQQSIRNDRCMSCMNLESQPSMGTASKEQTLGHFLSNINARGVRNGTFQLHFDGKKLEQVTLNVNHAETISVPHFNDNEYSEVLDNVASKEVFFQLPEKLRIYLKWPTSQISEYDLGNARA